MSSACGICYNTIIAGKEESAMLKNTKTTDDKYICPEKAVRKLRSGRRFRTPLYLYGVTGVGKTSLIIHNLNMKRCIYYSAAETEASQIAVREQGVEHTVVIDDLQSVTGVEEREAYYKVIQELLGREDVWLILIARCPFPRWLLTLRTKYIFVEIEESDFLFSIEEQRAYLEQYGICLPDELHERAWRMGGGNPLSLLFFAMEKGDLERTQKREWDYLESHVYEQWDVELQEFFMNICIVETFTIRLAAMLTGRSDVEKVIAKAEETGNFFETAGVDGVWKCRWPMRKSMRQRLGRKKTLEQIRRLYYTAGLYYELENQIPEALSMYEECRDMESISRLLISNANKNPSSGWYYELRRYYLELPEQIIEESPALMAGMSLLHSMLMNIEESERWYQALEQYADTHTGGQRREARSRLIYLKIALPHRGSMDMIDLIKNADLFLREWRSTLPDLSVTSNLPSMMNGGKDFCEWSRKEREMVVSIGKPVEFILGKYGKGLVSLILAESFLEKGEDTFEIFSQAEKGKMEAESGGKLDQVFVGIGTLAWLSVLKNNAEGAAASLAGFRTRAEKEAPNLLTNIDAFLCRISLYQGNDGASWMEQAPDETLEFSILERFRYLTKTRVYIQQKRYEEAYCLLQQLLYYAETMNRTYILMELHLLLAVVQYRTGQEEWRENLQACVSQAESYHFVRLLSREGSVLLSMLEEGEPTWKDRSFRKQVLEECGQMKEFYPRYLGGRQEDEIILSENAVKILRYQSEGLSSAAIAEKMKLSEATVKYHSRETYRKLGVKNKTAAIAEAKERKMI